MQKFLKSNHNSINKQVDPNTPEKTASTTKFQFNAQIQSTIIKIRPILFKNIKETSNNYYPISDLRNQLSTQSTV